MAENSFENVVLDAALADGFRRIGDIIETFRMEVEEWLREMGTDE